MIPMENHNVMGCPECFMMCAMNSPVLKVGEFFQCRSNPAHKFQLDNEGFLKSV
jgi:hypothetical protein